MQNAYSILAGLTEVLVFAAGAIGMIVAACILI
jgi:hypothetical protein